jgi:hypothetical protein
VGVYTTELSKGQGAIPETLTLLRHWQPGMSGDELARTTLAQGLLSRSTARRARDLVKTVFARRLLVHDGRPAEYLKYLVEHGADPAVVRQLLLVYAARLHPILRDFIAEAYWPRYAAGAKTLGRAEAERFIENARADARISPPWSAAMTVRVAGYLTGTLADFGLLENVRKSVREIRPYGLLPETALYLAYENHFKGFNDNSLMESPDWKLFGMARGDVVQQLGRVAREGHFILQYSGDLLRITWRYRTMGECLDVIVGKPL